MRPGRWPVAGALVALSGVSWILTTSTFRGDSGAVQPGAVLPLAATVALGLVIAAWDSSFRVAACWAALALVGEAAMLRMIHAGPTVGYQHYLPALEWARRPESLVLLLQAGLVLTGWRRVHRRVMEWIRRTLRPWQVVALGLLFLGTSATLSRSPVAFGEELLLATILQALQLATIVLAVLSLGPQALERLGALFARLFDRPCRPAWRDPLVLGSALFVLLLSAFLNQMVYQAHPHVPDEVAYLLQARYLSHGLLALPRPAVTGGFVLDLIYYGPKEIFSIFPPGWPAILALGMRAGAPWLVNPLLGGLNLLLLFAVVRRLYDVRVARFSVLLLAASPWYVFMAMSFMAHTATLTLALLAILGVQLARERHSIGGALLAGAAAGYTTLMRPLDGLILGGLLGLWALGLGGRRLRLAPLAAFVLAGVLVTAVNLPYNRRLTGNPRQFPVMAYFDTYYGPGSNAMGFGPNRGIGWSGLDPFPGHNLRDVAINTDFNAFATNVELFGWGTGSVLLIGLALVTRGRKREDWLLAAGIGTVVLAHAFYWFSGGPDFGARYWWLILLPCVVLTVRGLQWLATTAGPGDPAGWTRAAAGALALSAIALVTFFPWRATDKYYHYRGMEPGIRRLAKLDHFGRSLILIRGKGHPDYASAAVYNPLNLQADAPIYAWERSVELREQLLAHYADRPVWEVAGPTVGDGTYRVLEGPVPASTLLRRDSVVTPTDLPARVKSLLTPGSRKRTARPSAPPEGPEEDE